MPAHGHDVARLVALTAIELGSDRPEMHFHIAYGSADAGEDDAAAQAEAFNVAEQIRGRMLLDALHRDSTADSLDTAMSESEQALVERLREHRRWLNWIYSSLADGLEPSPDLLEAEAALANVPTGAGETGPKAVGVAPGATGLNELQALRQRLDGKLAELEAAYETQRAQWPDQYIAALMQQMERFQKAGDYENWNSVNTEHERFLIDRRLALEDIAAAPEPLRRLQLQHIDLLRGIGRKRAEAVRTLFDGHGAELEEWKRNLTRAGDMDLAAAVNAEVQQLKARQVYLAAVRELAPPPATTGSEQLVVSPIWIVRMTKGAPRPACVTVWPTTPYGPAVLLYCPSKTTRNSLAL